MEFHVSRKIRQKTDVDDLFFGYAGNVVFGDLKACRVFVERFNASRSATGEAAEPLHAGALFAMALIDELNHAMVAQYRRKQDPELLSAALAWLEAAENRTAVEGLLTTFVDQFPSVDVYRNRVSVAEWLKGTTPAGEADDEGDMPNRQAALEELLMLWLANTNPAFSPFKELFDDRPLSRGTIYRRATEELPRFFETRPPVSEQQGSLLAVLQAPVLASPDSLTGQLAYMRENWTQELGPEFGKALGRTLLAVDVLQEEAVAIWITFHPEHGTGSQGGGRGHAEGFLGDEFVGFDGSAARGEQGARTYAPEQPLPLNEYEAFSQDQSWMPTVVLIAKSTYVWLEQLSQKYLRHIARLDQIPGEELALLAARGINGLWLIGLWERSTASQTIKRLRGQADAVASAYSLKDYRIAEDLGGNQAYERLRELAAQVGIRLASDMVPNHMGIDSTWVMEHPEWFLSRPDSPYPVYSFDGPDLSNESRFEIKIEDHYYNQTDAAVVFQLRERANGETRFVYHGNDGTTFAWNDTAQLDYSKAAVREQVIQTILAVARQFPIIRFDAAMTLAKKHVQRLWFPLPGIGGSIPSRAESAMSQAAFDALMPEEFWREVVDRVAAEVPGTLLLAEAFWLLEGYFVRTLGMHRVYNSAFMNMLRDEENAKCRSYLKKTIEFDPDILKRYVNFMSNPDERTAVDQFGSGDKYFGVCTMLSTLPGLPMFGHGQIEAFTEKYGMEYKQAKHIEVPNADLIARHQREIAPLLKNRQLFAESHNFALYDFWTGAGEVDENVFVYSNRVDRADGCERALIFYNNRYESTRGTIDLCVSAMDKPAGRLRQRRLSEGLRIANERNHFYAWRDTANNLEYLRCASDFEQGGFTVQLRGYQYAVLLHWRELVATEAQPWDKLATALNGAGVNSVDDALSSLRLRPLHEALRAALSVEVLEGFAAAAAECLGASGIAATLAAEQRSSDVFLARDHVPEDERLQATKNESLSRGSQQRDADERIGGMTGPHSDSSVASVLVTEAANESLEAFLVPLFLAAALFRSAAEACPRDANKPSPAASVSGLEPGSEVEAGRSGEKTDQLAASEVAAPATKGDVFAERSFRLAALSRVERDLAESWPQAVRAVLPEGDHQTSWAPLIAWLLIDVLDSPVEAFDQLHLRAALAEIFQSLGMAGEDAWRTAARVRILLAYGGGDDGAKQQTLQTDELLASDAFWADPDVRWLTALNESNGTTYVNQECLEEMLWWLQVPSLVSAVSETNKDRAIESVVENVLRCDAAAKEAGFDLQAIRRLLHESASPASSQEDASETDVAEDSSVEALPTKID